MYLPKWLRYAPEGNSLNICKISGVLSKGAFHFSEREFRFLSKLFSQLSQILIVCTKEMVFSGKTLGKKLISFANRLVR